MPVIWPPVNLLEIIGVLAIVVEWSASSFVERAAGMALMRLTLIGMMAVVWLNAAAAAQELGNVKIVNSKPVLCLELNATGTIVYNHCSEFVRFGWRNTTNCTDGCETEIAPNGFATVAGLNGRFYYGACRSDQKVTWLGWKYSCYRRDR